MAAAAPYDPVRVVAFLNVQFLNDHADLEPTTNAERVRLASIESLFKAKLEASGQYKFIPADAAAKMAPGPEIGTCGGCEFDYGKQLGADYAAWIVVQKVSDLILNLNVYMADIATRKLGRYPWQHGRIVDSRHHLSGEELPFGGSMMTRMVSDDVAVVRRARHGREIATNRVREIQAQLIAELRLIITCRTCHGEGFIEHGHPNAPHADWVEPCRQCDETGSEEIEDEPLLIEDLEDCFGGRWELERS
jgi:hypothetical protein